MNIQDELLEELKEEGKEVTIYLIRGTRITGKIVGADQFTILLDVNGEKQLIYKHAISTIVAET
ncbi:MAG TPA: RNA chaperone Hfq [Persephonella sp.]|uniref:RNA-binding protein Hfq n=1 Tax=Persephonella marina (strain DSM 14350 / EX-H1) TaxID=123214 RepID=C0QUG3_PERMH|nr:MULTISPECIES: RNA chaperone Hfq [Persephonella]ACO03975.1 RNA chaperone Hfq [Persephonella marina EX-H1]HCB70053.1 RNA chaperone Hfq [Persephonella sp.]